MPSLTRLLLEGISDAGIIRLQSHVVIQDPESSLRPVEVRKGCDIVGNDSGDAALAGRDARCGSFCSRYSRNP